MGRTSGPETQPPTPLRRLWRRLTEPASAITDAGDRRSVRLLATVLLVFIVLGSASAAAQLLVVPGFTTRFLIITTALLLLGFAYAMSRTAHFRLAGAAASAVPIVAGGAVGLTTPGDPLWFAFMGLGTAIAGGLLPSRQVAVVAAATVAATALVAFLRGDFTAGGNGVAILAFSTVLAALVLAATWHLARVEQAREREVRESQALYRLLVDNAPLGIGVAAADGRLLAFNDAMLAPGGYTRADLGEQPNVSDLYYDPEARNALLGRLQRDGRVVRADVQFRARDGSPYDTLMSLVPFVYDGERCVLAILEDVTERRQAERERRDLADIIEKSRNEVYLFDPETLRFTYANEGARRNVGYTLEQLQALTPLDLKPEFDADAFRALIEPVRRGDRELLRFETVHQRADGSRYPVEAYLQMATSLGQPVVLAVILDTSARHQAEADKARLSAQLAAQEHRFRLLIERSSDLIALVDADARVHYVNPAVEETLGFRAEDWIGKDFRGVVWPDDRAHAEALFAQSLAAPGEVVTWTLRVRHADGTPRWLEGTGTNRLADPATRGVVLNCRDVTERRRAEDVLRQAQKMETVGQLAGGVAHDYNNMLSVILMNAEHALGTLDPNAPIRADLEDIRTAARRSADLTRQLLAFARRQPVTPRVIGLNDAVTSALAMLRRVIGEDIQLHWHPSPDAGTIRIDPAQLEQVLLNLCLNARDAITGVGTVTIESAAAMLDKVASARLSGGRPGRYAELTITDDGCGMDAQTLTRIFEPFFTTKAMGQGTGLGLATVYGIVKQNQGLIHVRSTPGSGTTFTLRFPRHAEPATRARAEAVEAALDSRGETILVVEDEEAVLRSTQRLLEDLGYVVLTAGTPVEALQAVADHPGRIHLLLTDLIMPQMDGRELAARLTSLRPRLRCLFMSGYSTNGFTRTQTGEPPFIQKPFSQDELATAVRGVLDQP